MAATATGGAGTARVDVMLAIVDFPMPEEAHRRRLWERKLQLEVTPHITADGSVLMKIVATNNQPDPSSTGANGQPAIQRKEANTQVLVHDSDTTVIGGIYVRQASNNVATVPILGKIPVLGYFFRNNRDLDVRNELLIFITPRILRDTLTNRRKIESNYPSTDSTIAIAANTENIIPKTRPNHRSRSRS